MPALVQCTYTTAPASIFLYFKMNSNVHAGGTSLHAAAVLYLLTCIMINETATGAAVSGTAPPAHHPGHIRT